MPVDKEEKVKSGSFSQRNDGSDHQNQRTQEGNNLAQFRKKNSMSLLQEIWSY